MSPAAASCPGCGHPFRAAAQTVVVQMPPTRKWSPGVAALLSFFIPGAGQIYKGQPINGLVWLGLTIAGYFMLLVPGMILHLFCILGAAMGDPTK